MTTGAQQLIEQIFVVANLTPEQAAEILLRHKTDKQTDRLLREYRAAKRELECAQIAYNNAGAQLVAAANKFKADAG